MTDYCPNCLEKMDPFHLCETTSAEPRKLKSGAQIWNTNNAVYPIIMLAPFLGLILDVVVPLPSSIIHSFSLSIFGSALAAILWIIIKFRNEKSFKFYIFNLKNFLFTPRLIKMFDTNQREHAVLKWFGAVVSSATLQILLFTPGNAAFLENQIGTQIKENSGANLSVTCPKMEIHFYTERFECRVKTGLFGITVPARAKLSPFWGSSQIKVSLF